MKMEFKLGYIVKRTTIPCKLDDRELGFNDLTFVYEGQLQYIIDGHAFTVSAGQAMYCPTGAARCRIRGTESATYVSINFHTFPQPSLQLPFHILAADSFDIRFSLNKLLEICERGDRSEKAEALVSFLVYTLYDCIGDNGENKHVALIKRYISDNWEKHITLEEIAASVYLSPSYASALFKEHTGTSIIDYIINLRISKACDMLRYSDLTISEISDCTGFCDIFYFSRMFKKHMGIAPSQYRLSAEKHTVQ